MAQDASQVPIVEIITPLKTRLNSGRDAGFAPLGRRSRPWSQPRFHGLERGPHIVPAPAHRPLVVVELCAARVDHCIDRTTSAKTMPGAEKEPSIAPPRIRFAKSIKEQTVVDERLLVAIGGERLAMGFGIGPMLKQQYTPDLGKFGGYDAARRATSDYDVVVRSHQPKSERRAVESRSPTPRKRDFVPGPYKVRSTPRTRS